MIAKFYCKGEEYGLALVEDAPREVWLPTRYFPGSDLELGQIRFFPVTVETEAETGERVQVYRWDGKPPTPSGIDINNCTFEEWAEVAEKLAEEVFAAMEKAELTIENCYIDPGDDGFGTVYLDPSVS